MCFYLIALIASARAALTEPQIFYPWFVEHDGRTWQEPALWACFSARFARMVPLWLAREDANRTPALTESGTSLNHIYVGGMAVAYWTAATASKERLGVEHGVFACPQQAQKSSGSCFVMGPKHAP